jgi:DNA-binding transcriptional MerR regulator
MIDMWTIKDLAKRFGLSERQVRLRLTALDDLLRQRMFTGEFGRTLVDDDGFKIFERLRQLEAKGLATSAAVEQLRQELSRDGGGGKGDRASETVNRGQDSELIAILKAEVEELRRDKAYLQEQLARALQQLEDLQRRALPPPPRRHWWWPWRRVTK